ncbi:tetraacyldisaccharide 4'-kinase [Alphaproteobacteria bacterium]|nr:tetraacyldisaccharide 4'-kinase [Alphaproteobacteria bacterium]
MFETPKFWYKKNLSSKSLSVLLFPLSLLWVIISLLKKLLIKRYKSKLKVICIGNLTIGGTGKTPFAIYTYKLLKKSGYKPIFLTRGYRGLLKGPIEVKDSHNFRDVGDEALLLNKIGTTIVSKDRSLGAKLIEKHKDNFDVIIMDDGLQNYQLEQDIKLLLVDKNLKFGNKFCIPAGPMREPISQGLMRVDAIVLTGNNNNDNNFNNVHNKILFNSKVKTIKSRKMKNEKFLAFCGLANSNKFYETLKENGFNVTTKKSFSDHYLYKNDDIDELMSEANSKNLKLITTEKDYIKIIDEKKMINTLPIEIELDVRDKDIFNSFLQEKLNG